MKGRLEPDHGKRLFCFRVRHGKHVLKVATVQHATLAEAYAATVRVHPGAEVNAIEPGPLAADGLPIG